MKKTMCVLLSLLMLLSLAACAGSGTQPDHTAAPADTSAPAAETPSSAPADEASAAPDVLLQNEGLTFTVPGKYSELLISDAPQNREDGILFTFYEKASVEAAPDAEGAGWLFSIGRLSEETLHELLCGDMSGCEPFATDAGGTHYAFYHPTDVRIERADSLTDEDMEQWGKLNEWAADARDSFVSANNLTPDTRSNISLAIDLSRIAYAGYQDYTVTALDNGVMYPMDVDPIPFVERLTKNIEYSYADPEETPDGEYIVLTLPEEGVRYDFFRGNTAYVREVRGDYEALYRASENGGDFDSTAVMQDWYDAMLEAAISLGSADDLVGVWAEKLSGRGMIEIIKNDADSYSVQIHWGNGASQTYFWSMSASPLGNAPILTYFDGKLTVITFEEDESSSEEIIYDHGVGSFSLNGDGELVWADDTEHQADETTFVRADTGE